jgi:hypothetical protein
MTNNPKPQSIHNIFVFQQKGIKQGRSHHISMQDKLALNGERLASRQPERPPNVMRAEKANSKTERVKERSSARLVHIQLWVKPAVRAEIERRAKNAGGKKPLSLSSAGAPLLERGLQTDIDLQYGALLGPAIRGIIHEELRAFRAQLSWLLTKVRVRRGYARSLVRQPEASPIAGLYYYLRQGPEDTNSGSGEHDSRPAAGF